VSVNVDVLLAMLADEWAGAEEPNGYLRQLSDGQCCEASEDLSLTAELPSVILGFLVEEDEEELMVVAVVVMVGIIRELLLVTELMPWASMETQLFD